MIVKNEARFISECLQSAKQIADQLIVVDTGSTDQTVELAQRAGAEVYHHPWRNNFSEARNHSLSYAQGQWILILDGDECLDSETIHLVHQLDLSEQGPEAYFFEIINFTTDRAVLEESGVISQVRLFRNRPTHRYGGLVHNQLQNTHTEQLLTGPEVPIKVLHYGYTPTVWAAQQKDDRILLHEQAVQEHPESHFVRYNYANHLKILEKYSEALEQFILAIPPIEVTGFASFKEGEYQVSAELEWALNACFLGAFCANKIGEYQIALSLTEEALHRSPALIDASVRRAETFIALKQYQEAIELLQHALLFEVPHLVKGRALYFDAPYRLGRAQFLAGLSAEATPTFASLIPNCIDVTVFTHLCLCATKLKLEPLWKFARKRGALVNADDPDWSTVDRVIAHTRSRPLNTLNWPRLIVECLDVRGGSAEDWSTHLCLGLEQLEPHTSTFLEILLQSPKTERIDDHDQSLSLKLVIHHKHARLSIDQNQERLYSFPERYAPLTRTEPIESAALLLAHLAILNIDS